MLYTLISTILDLFSRKMGFDLLYFAHHDKQKLDDVHSSFCLLNNGYYVIFHELANHVCPPFVCLHLMVKSQFQKSWEAL